MPAIDRSSELSIEVVKGKFPKPDALKKAPEIEASTLAALMEKIEAQAGKAQNVRHTTSMTDITREELDAKLEATNARVDARLASFESTIRETLAAVRQDSADIRGELKAIHIELGYLRNIKTSIWGAAGATIVAVAGIIGAMLSYGVANFDAGRETSQLLQEVRQQSFENKVLLEQIKTQQTATQSQPTPQQTQPVPQPGNK